MMQRRLQSLDIFPKFDSKFESDARDRTLAGGVLSMAALILMAALVITEIRFFFSVEQRHELFVDNTDLESTLQVTLNITFHRVPCDLITIDAVDAFNEYQEHMERSVRKHRVDKQGRYVEEVAELHRDKAEKAAQAVAADAGLTAAEKQAAIQQGKDPESCYGAEDFPGQKCPLCNDVRNAYERRRWHFDINDLSFVQCAKDRFVIAQQRSNEEGCTLEGSLKLRRVQGNIHLVPGRMFDHLGMHLHDFSGEDVKHLNLSHTINTLRFGDVFPGLVNPLDGHAVIIAEDDGLGLSPPQGGRAPAAPGTTTTFTSPAQEKGSQTLTARSNDKGVSVSVNEAAAKSNNNDGKANGDGGTTTSASPNSPPPPPKSFFGGGKFQYFVKVVPTRYERLMLSSSTSAAAPTAGSEASTSSAYTVETNQYSVTEHSNIFRPDDSNKRQQLPNLGGDPTAIPGVFIVYDLSPIKVRIYEARPYDSVVHLILQLCAVAGGLFTVMGLIDSVWYHGARHVKRKLELGKFT